jgi:hypothetical protein
MVGCILAIRLRSTYTPPVAPESGHNTRNAAFTHSRRWGVLPAKGEAT